MLFHNSIRKYTLALLSTFNGLKVEHKLSDGTYTQSNIPIVYTSKEKSTILDDHTTEQLLSGNYNVLPRIALSLTAMNRSDTRMTNKYIKINVKDGEFNFNAVPYEFTFDMDIICRGMNEASMIIEQIVTKFNPTYTIRINEVPNQSEPTSVPVQLLDISLSSEEFEEIHENMVTISVGLNLKGNFYSPIENMERIHEVDIYTHLWHEMNQSEETELIQYIYP
jgi:hypothetical protein